MQKARISLSGTDARKVDSICKMIKEISSKTGVEIAGPIPLPTKKLKVPVRGSRRFRSAVNSQATWAVCRWNTGV